MARENSKVSSLLRLSSARTLQVLREIGLPIPTPVRVVYHPNYVLPAPLGRSVHTPDIRRPDNILHELREAGLVGSHEVLTPLGPMSSEELLRVHPQEHLEALEDPGALARILCVEEGALQGIDPLRPFLFQTAGTALAAERAISDRIPTVNLGGGFHHARAVHAERFCPVNDLALAIERIRHLGLARRVLVVDLDFHQGDGTALIFADDEEVFTLSVHGKTLVQVDPARRNLDVELPPGTCDEAYLAAVISSLTRALETFQPELCLYVAGADVHAEDPAGSFQVSDDGVLARDLYVARIMEKAEVPLAVVLGGGHGPLAWTLPYNMLYSLITGARIPLALRPCNIEARYRKIKRSLKPAELRAGEGELSAEDVDDMFNRPSFGGLFMDTYTSQGLEIVLERYGFLDLLRDKGFDRFIVTIDVQDSERQIARLHFDHRDPEHLLVELAMRFCEVATPETTVGEGIPATYRMLSIEWLMMQDPTITFTHARRQLPGQLYPGLGLGRFFVELLRMMAERLGCDGLLNHPEHYHNALLYSKQMLFFLPEDQGVFAAMKRDLGKLPLVDTSLAIDERRLRGDGTDQPIPWECKPQVMPVRRRLKAYFARPAYHREAAQVRDQHRFWIEPAVESI